MKDFFFARKQHVYQQIGEKETQENYKKF